MSEFDDRTTNPCCAASHYDDFSPDLPQLMVKYRILRHPRNKIRVVNCVGVLGNVGVASLI